MSSLRYTSVGVMRPPKPPCWRDFVSSSPKSIHSDGVEILESSGRALGARSPVADLIETSRFTVSLSGNKPSRLVRRPRARIHRTRSEHIIRSEDLPEHAFTATLADADPKGLRVRIPDGRLYVEENNRRCQNWLAGVEAAEPLDEVDYKVNQRASSSPVPETPRIRSENSDAPKSEDSKAQRLKYLEKDAMSIYELRQSVDVEIPEETFIWDTSSKAHSTSSDEEMSGTFKDMISQDGCDKISEIPVCSGTFSSTHSTESAQRPTFNSRQQTGSTTGGQITQGDNKCENNSRNYAAKELKCDKRTNDKKFQKLCCDRDYTESSSGTDNNSTRCHVISERRSDNLLKHLDTNEDSISNKGSHLSLAPSNSRSLSRRATSDSELWALNVSTCD